MNSFGRLFRISIFGESHGPMIGIVIDGCPPGIEIDSAGFETDLARRRSGAIGTTPRIEPDIPEFGSGVFNGVTTGAP
ncbi:MAG: chorismate synthase, partial [Bacteroidota bacterium]|nr:chorismate synthase [Bacteroidota bacterium]